MNTQNTVAAVGSSSSLINDDSLRAERTYENAPTNRVKHVALSKRRELYKKQMGDVSQVVSSLTSSSSSSSSKRGDEKRRSSSSNSTSSDESSAATVPASSGKKGSSSRHEEIVDPLVKSWHGGFSLDDLPKLPSATITSIHEDDDAPTMSKRQGSAVSTATPPKLYQPVRQQRRRPARRVSMESDSSISIGSLFNDEDGSTKMVVTPTKDDFSRSDASLDKKKKSSRRDTHPSSPTTNKKSNRRRASDATAATAPLYDSDSSNRESSNLFNSDPTLLGPESSPTSVASPQVQVTKPKVRSRRATVDNSAVSAPKVTLRRKYQPRHRSMANGSVQGIVKPSRYTRCGGGSETGSVTSVTSSKSVPTSFASLSKKEETRNTKEQQPSPRRRSMFKRRASLPDKISRPQLSGSFTQLKPREITKLKNLSIDLEQEQEGSNCSPNVIPSSDDSESSLSDTEEYTNEEGESKIKRITSTSSMSSCAAAVDTSNDSWIPHGVDFSASMEVYVFEKYQHKI